MTDVVLFFRSIYEVSDFFGCSRYGSRVVPEAAKLRIEEAGPRKRMWSVTRPQLIAVLLREQASSPWLGIVKSTKTS